ncbi:MAG: iron-sulfur cluster assembly scaffold protein [Planctomycetes bacterium]|nr:iron-sulfur cluster assembly scaffold protein [Planctomycetota bacterium]
MPRFSQTLLDHARSPRNAGKLDRADAVGEASLHGRAPYTTVYLTFDGDVIAQASFEAFGCGVTIASCSALTEIIVGKTEEECLGIESETVMKALNGIPADKAFCAELAVEALRMAIANRETR